MTSLLWSELTMKGRPFLARKETRGKEGHKTIGSNNPNTRDHDKRVPLRVNMLGMWEA